MPNQQENLNCLPQEILKSIRMRKKGVYMYTE